MWCLRRRSSDVRCVLYTDRIPMEVHVLQDRDVVLAECFATERGALDWVEEYGARLREQGWTDRPEDCSPSSAA